MHLIPPELPLPLTVPPPTLSSADRVQGCGQADGGDAARAGNTQHARAPPAASLNTVIVTHPELSLSTRFLSQLTRQLSQFQSQLSSFAASHKAAINANPILRYQFHLACTSIGVDPLTSHRSLFSSLLSLGDLYYTLAVHIVECTMVTRAVDGGIMGMHELLAMLYRKTKQRVSEADVRQAVERMGVLGGGFALVDVGGGRVMVRSVPQQLDVDEMHVLSWLNTRRTAGRYTVTEAASGLHWSRRRVDEVTRRMLQAGLLWLDAASSDEKEDEYWYTTTAIHAALDRSSHPLELHCTATDVTCCTLIALAGSTRCSWSRWDKQATAMMGTNELRVGLELPAFAKAAAAVVQVVEWA